MCMYVRLIGSLAQNLFRRVGDDLADCTVFMKRGCVYKMRCLRRKFDDVGPDEGDGEAYVALAEHQAELVSGLENYAWFGHMDRKSAQEYVHRGGQGCFIVRPSSSTRSLTLTLRHGNRTYNILIRRRDDGLIALGSKKNNELVFRTVEEMCNHYASNELILYSGGELAGKTLLKFPCQVISQQPISPQVSTDHINHHSLASKLSLDSIDNIPRTLEESVHRAAQRSMSLRTFEEKNTNNQPLERNSSSIKKSMSKRLGDINQHHRSYENVKLNNNEQNNLSFHSPLGHSMKVLNPNKLQNGDVSKSEGNFKTSLTSTGLGRKSKYNDQLNKTEKENTEGKQLPLRHFDGESSRKIIKVALHPLSLIQTSNENMQNPNKLNENKAENSLMFTNSGVKNTEKLSIQSGTENKLVNKCKLYENEKKGLSSKTLLSSPELDQTSVHKNQSIKILKEKNQLHCLPQEEFFSKDGQRSLTERSLVPEELKQNCDNDSENNDSQQIHAPLQNTITTNIKSSLASSEFISKVIKTSLLDKCMEEEVQKQDKQSTAPKGLIKRNTDSFKHNDRLKENINHSSISNENVDLSVQVNKSLIVRPMADQTHDIIYSQKNAKESIEKETDTNFFVGSIGICKENLFGTVQLVQKSSQNSQSEEKKHVKLKSKIELSKTSMKELQNFTQSKTNDNNEPYLPSTVKKLNFINDQKVNYQTLYDSKQSQLETANQDQNDKFPKETISKTKLAASFFEELAKKNQT